MTQIIVLDYLGDELLKLHEHAIDVVRGLDNQIEKYALREDYEFCARLRDRKQLHEVYIDRIGRLLDGLPAFEEEVKQFNHFEK